MDHEIVNISMHEKYLPYEMSSIVDSKIVSEKNFFIIVTRLMQIVRSIYVPHMVCVSVRLLLLAGVYK